MPLLHCSAKSDCKIKNSVFQNQDDFPQELIPILHSYLYEEKSRPFAGNGFDTYKQTRSLRS